MYLYKVMGWGRSTARKELYRWVRKRFSVSCVKNSRIEEKQRYRQSSFLDPSQSQFSRVSRFCAWILLLVKDFQGSEKGLWKPRSPSTPKDFMKPADVEVLWVLLCGCSYVVHRWLKTQKKKKKKNWKGEKKTTSDFICFLLWIVSHSSCCM